MARLQYENGNFKIGGSTFCAFTCVAIRARLTPRYFAALSPTSYTSTGTHGAGTAPASAAGPPPVPPPPAAGRRKSYLKGLFPLAEPPGENLPETASLASFLPSAATDATDKNAPDGDDGAPSAVSLEKDNRSGPVGTIGQENDDAEPVAIAGSNEDRSAAAPGDGPDAVDTTAAAVATDEAAGAAALAAPEAETVQVPAAASDSGGFDNKGSGISDDAGNAGDACDGGYPPPSAEVVWFEGWDAQREAYYYFNRETKESTWAKPSAPFVACGDASSDDDDDDDEDEDDKDGDENEDDDRSRDDGDKEKVVVVAGEAGGLQARDGWPPRVADRGLGGGNEGGNGGGSNWAGHTGGGDFLDPAAAGAAGVEGLESLAWIPPRVGAAEARSLLGELMFNEAEFGGLAAWERAEEAATNRQR